MWRVVIKQPLKSLIFLSSSSLVGFYSYYSHCSSTPSSQYLISDVTLSSTNSSSNSTFPPSSSRNSSSTFTLPPYSSFQESSNTSLQELQTTMKGLKRIYNLVSTVAVISYDYLQIINQNKGIIKPSDVAKEELTKLRLEHEKLGMKLHNSTNNEEKEKLQQEMKLLIQQLKETSVSSSPTSCFHISLLHSFILCLLLSLSFFFE